MARFDVDPGVVGDDRISVTAGVDQALVSVGEADLPGPGAQLVIINVSRDPDAAGEVAAQLTPAQSQVLVRGGWRLERLDLNGDGAVNGSELGL